MAWAGGANREDLQTYEEEGAVQAVHVLGPALADALVNSAATTKHMSSQQQQG